MQEVEPQLQGGEDLKKELDVLPSWGKTGQLVIAQFRGSGWRIPITGNPFYIQASLQPAAWAHFKCTVSTKTPATLP